MSNLLSNIVYYQDNKVALDEALNEIVESVVPEAGDEPAFQFAVLVEAFERDPQKAITIAVAAVMRLAEQVPAGDAS